MTYEEARLFIDEANKKGIVLGLDNTRELLKRLGNPQDKLSFVHIAGTNGKGSAVAYISTVLQESGYIVGRYVSPTIFSYRERIQVNEEWISREDLAKYIDIIKKIVDEMVSEGLPHPTAFEIETAVGFLYFKDKRCEVVVLETGLGGDSDATNVIETVICSIIMSISYDHTRILGNTIEEIATHKAGIIKKGVPVVLYKDNIEANLSDDKKKIEKVNDEKVIEAVIRKRCEEFGCELILTKPNLIKISAGQENLLKSNKYCDITKEKQEKSNKNNHKLDDINKETLDYKVSDYEKSEDITQHFSYKEHINLSISLLGQFQLYNVATAIEAIDVLRRKGYKISEDNLRVGLRKTVWPARLEIISKNPLIVIDGAHNPDAALKLRESIELYFTNKKKIYIMGILSDKDYRKIIKITANLSDIIYTITPNNARALKAKDLKAVIEEEFPKKEVMTTKSMAEAIEKALNIADENSVIIAFGSLSYLGEFRRLIQERL